MLALSYWNICISNATCNQRAGAINILGEPSAEYTAYYSYEQPENVDEERFNRYVNLGITAEDMQIRLGGIVDERDLEPFRYPDLSELRDLKYRSVCLGSYIPWDVKEQVKVIKRRVKLEGRHS